MVSMLTAVAHLGVNDKYDFQGTSVLYYSHFTMMSCFGIWVRSTVTHFGSSPECNSATTLRFFGKEWAATNSEFRIVMLVVYSIGAIPAVNLSALMHLAHRAVSEHRELRRSSPHIRGCL